MAQENNLLGKPPAIPLVLCLPLAAGGLAALYAACLLPAKQVEFSVLSTMTDPAAWTRELDWPSIFSAGSQYVEMLTFTLNVCGIFWLLVACAGLLSRRPWGLNAVRAGWLVVVPFSLLAGMVAYVGTTNLFETLKLLGEKPPPAIDVFALRWSYLRWSLLAVVVAGGMLVLSWRAMTIRLYHPRPPAAAPGDALVENIRTSGADPRYRRSWLSSSFLHYLIIIVLPFLWALRGCVEPYRVPYGSGKAAVVRVMRMVRQKKQKRKKYLLRENAAVYWDLPDLVKDSKIAEEVDEATQLTHTADRNAVHGAMGAGGGTKGGWPEGVPGGKIRFIRMEYRGLDWDDGMDEKSAADINFLNFLRQEVPFPVAHKGESHPIRLLKKYPRGFAPPFIYMTGQDRIDTSSYDMGVLREYLLDGGMLFADCGGPRWDGSFRGFIAAALPGMRLIDIPDDDELYQMPYTFSNGAPSLWHHGGMRALGVKHKGRWIVFYHPGDMNDAWKTGNSGMDSDLADKSFQMGINVLYYAITHYLELTKKHRKL